MTYGTYCRLHVHVSASPREVIEAVRLKLRKAVRRDPAHREDRKAIYREALKYHREAQRIAQTWRL